MRLRWPREARGHAATFSAPRGCDRPAGASPGEIHWAVYRRNRDGSEPRYYLSNAPEDTPLETLAYVGGSRWRIETEFETEKKRRRPGRVRDPHLGLAGITTWPCACWAELFC